jgi:hypothetical protein
MAVEGINDGFRRERPSTARWPLRPAFRVCIWPGPVPGRPVPSIAPHPPAVSDLRSLLRDWPALSPRLDEALELAPERRAAWIDALPETEPVRRALRDILLGAGADAATRAGLDAPRLALDDGNDGSDGSDGDGAADPDDGLAAGARVGPYRLVRELGRGGMGIVWLAERDDGALRRTVALKLPRLGAAPGLHARMRRERDILASLAHPHIAAIHDAGVDAAGRPYLALEHVDGEPIDRFVRARGLPTAARVRLLLQVARAVAHAHGRLVVHRDLKPANILVTPGGEVRLLDFGIARLLEDARTAESPTTRQAGRALTLDYASPEQLRGEPIGTASDVYSLAVVAYEVLTERKPYRLKRPTAAALEEAIVSLDVRPASAAAEDPAARRALRGDLDAVLNRAMKKDAAERYPSVEAFAQDLERHLARLPVQARPDALGYRMRRFAARNALAVGAAAAVAVALAGGAGVALWQARAARLEALRAEQVKDFALSIVNGADTESGANRETTAVELLQAARARVEQQLGGSPATAVELMTAVGAGLQSQGRVAEAAALLGSARERAARTLGDAHALTLAATNAYGLALLGSDRPKDAIAVLAPAASAAARAGQPRAETEALFNLSSAQLAAAEGEAGLASARAAVAALERQGGAARPLDAFNAWGQLANALNATQQPGLADAARRAVALSRAVEGTRVTGNALNARLLLARGLAAEGRDADALAELEAVHADALRTFGPGQPRMEPIALFLGLGRADAGDLDGAVAAFREALAVAEAMPGGTGGNRGIDHFSLGRALAAKRDDAAALAHLTTAATLLAEAVGAAPQTLRARSWRAAVLTRLGRLDEADAVFASLAGAAWPAAEQAQNDGRLALLRSRQGRHAEAVALARASAAALAAHPAKPVRAVAAATLGRVLLAAGDRDAARAPLREAARLYAERQTVPTPDRADVERDLAAAG